MIVISSKHKTIITYVCVAIVLVGGIFVAYSYIYEKNESGTQPTLKTIKNIAPQGWYEHRLSKSSVILTRSKELPDINAQIYAYGAFIEVSVREFTGDPKYREGWEPLKWIHDEALVRKKDWVTVNDMGAIRVRHAAAGADGEQLTFYLFDNGYAHHLTLYPANSEYADSFEQFAYDYAERISNP